MEYSVDEVEGEKKHPIVIRLSGEDVSFIVQKNQISIYLDEKTAESIAFHISSLLQDRERRGKQ